MELIPLTQGQFAMVDDEDFECLNQRKWIAIKSKKRNAYYAMKSEQISGNKILIGMHRVIMGLEMSSKLVVDHIDGNGLNNQRANLRLATASQNTINSRRKEKSKSGFRGVYAHPAGKFRSLIKVNGKKKDLGQFKTAIEAAMAYNKAAIELHGEFAVLNKF